jgi:nitroimidazol reductase NimA-like FMN-containing flavoprotein (pyridoxamine 5'-phosphate oxidase superfamily)
MPQHKRTTIRRLPKRAAYDRATIDSILDEALVCHLGIVRDDSPVVVPTLQARVGDDLYVHGSAASRTLRALSGGIEICLTVTLVDGLVLARSAFHHSVNYRSVMLFGRAELLEAAEDKRRALEAFTEKLVPGRWPDVRPPSPNELKATAVLRLPIGEASAKVRSGPPLDDEEDYERDVWAGVIPLGLCRLPPEPDPKLKSGLELPTYLRANRRPRHADSESTL